MYYGVKKRKRDNDNSAVQLFNSMYDHVTRKSEVRNTTYNIKIA